MYCLCDLSSWWLILVWVQVAIRISAFICALFPFSPSSTGWCYCCCCSCSRMARASAQGFKLELEGPKSLPLVQGWSGEGGCRGITCIVIWITCRVYGNTSVLSVPDAYCKHTAWVSPELKKMTQACPGSGFTHIFATCFNMGQRDLCECLFTEKEAGCVSPLALWQSFSAEATCPCSSACPSQSFARSRRCAVNLNFMNIFPPLPQK